ncbi:Clumping factor A-related surface protein [Fructobacillus evanidus]|nr:Clumping factor A-related surface protein [Fructobacillus sp. LMG 32999]CAK1224997.1 Clumping factor A-related surface protein [Fructobacillus sp. LMG 32999]CAK1225165.1 Clumping factor A-related surface protein [Fructobacillus sp. LMG 32999]CAK1229387.1 Clumping factor A-related surface protein [Fructobacillus sp. LMG 32999]
MKKISKNSWRSLLIETAVFGTITFMAPVVLTDHASADSANDSTQQGKMSDTIEQSKTNATTPSINTSTGTADSAKSTTAVQSINDQSDSGTATELVSPESTTDSKSTAASAVTNQKNQVVSSPTATSQTAQQSQQSSASTTSSQNSQQGSALGDATPAGTTASGTWGTVPWAFNQTSGVVTLGSGTVSAQNQILEKVVPNALQSVKQIQVTGNVQIVGDATGLFNMLTALTSFTIMPGGHLDTSQTTNMSNMFALDFALPSIDLSTWDMSHTQDIEGMFSNDKVLTNVTGLETRDLSAVTNAGDVFLSTPLANQGTLSWNSWQWLTGNHPVKGLARNADVHWGTAKAHYDAQTLTLTVGSADDGSEGVIPSSSLTSIGQLNQEQILKIVFTKPVKVAGPGTSTFADFPYLKSIEGVNLVDTSQVTDFSNFFAGNPLLTTLDLSNLDTHNATQMYDMFNADKSLTTLDVSHFDTSNVTDMWAMFANLYRLQSITGINGLNVSKVTNMHNLFYNDMSLQSLDLSSWNAKVQLAPGAKKDLNDGTGGMFVNTVSLKSLNIRNLDNTADSAQENMFTMNASLVDSATSPLSANQFTSHLTELTTGPKFIMNSENDLNTTVPNTIWNRYDSNGHLTIFVGSAINTGMANPGDWQAGQAYRLVDQVTGQQIGGNHIIQGLPGSQVTVTIPDSYRLVNTNLYYTDQPVQHTKVAQFILAKNLDINKPVILYLIKEVPVTVNFVDHNQTIASYQKTVDEGTDMDVSSQLPKGYQAADKADLTFQVGNQDLVLNIPVLTGSEIPMPSTTPTSGTATTPSSSSATPSSTTPSSSSVTPSSTTPSSSSATSSSTTPSSNSVTPSSTTPSSSSVTPSSTTPSSSSVTPSSTTPSSSSVTPSSTTPSSSSVTPSSTTPSSSSVTPSSTTPSSSSVTPSSTTPSSSSVTPSSTTPSSSSVTSSSTTASSSITESRMTKFQSVLPATGKKQGSQSVFLNLLALIGSGFAALKIFGRKH